jgi:hypothetical protein
MNKALKFGFITTSLITPVFAFAALEGVRTLIEDLGYIVGIAIPIAAGLALLFFFWGLAKFIFKANDPTARKEGKNIMIWGIVALFVMVSIWGLVEFIQDELDLPPGGGYQEVPILI